MAASTLEHVTFIVPGVTCGHCVAKIYDAMQRVEGIVTAQANAETHFVDIDFDPQVIKPSEIADLLADAGYPVRV